MSWNVVEALRLAANRQDRRDKINKVTEWSQRHFGTSEVKLYMYCSIASYVLIISQR